MNGIGLIGCGAWGVNYLKTLSLIPEAEVLYVCDLNETVLNRVKLIYPRSKVTTTYQDLLKDEKVKGVIIATPPVTHYSIALDFLMHSKAVLVEKPVTLSYDDAERLVEIARKNNAALMAGHLMEYHPAVGRLQKYISQGVFGELRYILLERASMGRNRSDVSVVWDLAVHDLSIVRFLVDREPRWVSVQGKSFLRNDIHDLVTITMALSGDLFVQIHANWLYPIKKRQTVVAGERIAAVLDDVEEDFKLRLITYNGDIVMPKLENVLPLTRQCLHFLDCIKLNIEPRTGPHDILWIIRLMDLIEQSLHRNGTRIYFR